MRSIKGNYKEKFKADRESIKFRCNCGRMNDVKIFRTPKNEPPDCFRCKYFFPKFYEVEMPAIEPLYGHRAIEPPRRYDRLRESYCALMRTEIREDFFWQSRRYDSRCPLVADWRKK